MKNIAKKKLNITLTITALMILSVLFFIFANKWQYSGTNRAESTFGDRFIGSGNTSGLVFDINEGTISGIKMQFFRNFIITDEDNRYLEVVTKYHDDNDREQIESQRFKLSTIKGRRYNYIDIKDIKIVKPTKITFSFSLDRPLEGEDYFQIGYDDSDPDSLIDRSPRIIYKVDSASFMNDVSRNIGQDHKFFLGYFILISFVILPILVLVITNKKIDN